MTGIAVVGICVAIFVYIEIAIGVGYYMFLLTSKEEREINEEQKKKIRKYSIFAGAAFPVTLAIIIASKAAEGR